MLPVISPTQQDWLKTATGTPTQYAPGLAPNSSGVLGASTYAAPVAAPATAPAAPSSSDRFNAALPGLVDSYMTGANTGISTAANSRNMSVLDYLDQAKQNQINIDRQAQQNELSKLQGTRGVLDMVGQGISSGGVQLANRNASNSSAGEALARAYGQLGRTDLSQVGNQYEQGRNSIGNAEDDLARANASKSRDFDLDKTNVVNSIVGNLQQQLASLNASATTAGASPVDVATRTAQIKQQALDSLSKYDQVLASGLSGITPAATEANRVSATNLLNAGTAPENAFSYSTIGPSQFQGTGPMPTTLPIYTNPAKKTNG